MKDTVVLKGLRREMTRELFEELVALQCGPEEILGYIGTDRIRLELWCRRVYGRRYSLEEMMSMIRQDGLIAIRRASFDQLKKSATVVSQQYNRFLPNAGQPAEEEEAAAVQAFAKLMGTVQDTTVKELFHPCEQEEAPLT